MNSIADQLPPDIARQVHPDWRRNESDYWTQRDQLLSQYQDQWIGFANGRVIASGTSPVEVLHAAQQTGQHPYVACVGRENEPARIRRAEFSYDTRYRGEALPAIEVGFRASPGSRGIDFAGVILDTGADATVLPWADCQSLQLSPGEGVPGFFSGVAGGSAATLAFTIFAHLDGRDYPCRLQADFNGNDRILGRDVLNRLDVLFRGPTLQVVINP